MLLLRYNINAQGSNTIMKILGKFIPLLLLSILLAGCAAPSTSDSDDTNTGGQITIQWWGVFWDESVVKSLIDEYEAANPNVKIEYANMWQQYFQSRTPYQQAAQGYRSRLDSVLAGGNSAEIPDIFMINNTWTGRYEKYLKAAPASVITADEVSSDFYPVVSTDFVRNSQVLGLPLWLDALAIIYNPNVLETASITRPPTNWPDFKLLAQTLTRRAAGNINIAGFAAGTYDNVSFASELMNLLLVQNLPNGASSMVDTSGPNFANFTEALEALQFYQSFATPSTGTWSSSFSTNDALAFLSGENTLGMIVAPSWRYYDLIYFNEKYDLGIEMEVSPMPQLEGQPVRNWATYWGNVVAKDRPNSEESWKFLDWITQAEQLRKLRANEALSREIFQLLYPRLDMQNELRDNKYLQVYNSALLTAESWYMIDGSCVSEAFSKMISSTGNAGTLSQAENNIQKLFTNKDNLAVTGGCSF